MFDMIYALVVGGMFGVGLFQLLRRNLVRAAIGLILITNAINLFLLSAGAYDGVVAPYTTEIAQRSDALPQALVLTAIVINMGGFVLVMSMLYVIAARHKSLDSDDVKGLRH